MTSELDLSICDLEARIGVTRKERADCETHGPYVSTWSKHRDFASGCPTCFEVEQKKVQEQERLALSRRMAEQRLERRLGAALIPPRFQGKTFDDYRVVTNSQRKALETCREYATNFPGNLEEGRSLLLLGKVGTGKTHLANAVAGHVIVNHGCSAVYRTVTSIMQYVKGSFSNAADYTETDAHEALISPDLLIIDEVGATKPTEFEQATIFNIINGRYEQCRPTIVISNLMPEELPAAIGERCVDRLREGGGKALVFDWASARKGNAA